METSITITIHTCMCWNEKQLDVHTREIDYSREWNNVLKHP